MKEIKDYLYLYLGCTIWDFHNKKEGILFGINRSSINNVKILHGEDIWNLRYTSVKPILRPISDLTIQEMEINENILDRYDPDEMETAIMGMAASVNYLRSIHVDIDGLIDAGLAIDKTTLK